MNNYIFIYIVLFFVYLFLHAFLNKYKENFDNKKNSIVLIGDSILENTNYVQEYYNVESSIKQQHYNVINLAKDNATIEDVKTQLYFLDKKNINISDVIFISIGGNNILNHYQFRRKENATHLDKIFDKYTNTISNIKSKYNNRIVLINIYSPPKIKVFHKLIKIWNKKLNDFANKKNIKILDINSLMNNERYFVKKIEPSREGSKIIANTIIKSI